MFSLTKIPKWVTLASSFLLGQGLVQALALLVGLLLARILPVDEYALYTIAGALLAFVSLSSNFGLGHALVSLGAARREDAGYVGAMFNAARSESHRLFGVAAPATVALAVYMFHGCAWPLHAQAGCVALVLSIGFVQINTSLGRSLFNMHHDAVAIFQTGSVEGLVRLVLIIVCVAWPLTVTALAANLLGAVVASLIANRRTRRLLDVTAISYDRHRDALRKFVLPIAPMAIYTLAQGQIAVLLLSVAGHTRAIADMGALSRLGQLFTIITMLNPFMVQPVFARVTQRRDFLLKLGIVTVALFLLSSVGLLSAYLAPTWWLLALGTNYSNLEGELPIAIGTALATVIGGALYAIVIARGETSGQSLWILPCLVGQVAFIALHGVYNTRDALLLNAIPAIAIALVECLLLTKCVHRFLFPMASAVENNMLR